jgi:hypothetical protein
MWTNQTIKYIYIYSFIVTTVVIMLVLSVFMNDDNNNCDDCVKVMIYLGIGNIMCAMVTLFLHLLNFKLGIRSQYKFVYVHYLYLLIFFFLFIGFSLFGVIH